MKIQHITPNIDLGASSRLKQECRRALSSIKTAKRNFSQGEVRVTVLSPDVPCVNLPDWVDEIGALSDARSVFGFSDIYPMVPLKEALQNIDENVDLVVLTNPDISVAPDFYNRIAEYFCEGVSSINIHRDTIPDEGGKIAPIQAVLGPTTPHEGSDCFVFTPEKAKNFVAGGLVIGMSPVDDAMLINMRLQDESFIRLVGQKLTFHFGDDRPWNKDVRDTYFPQSYLLGKRVVDELISKYGDFPVFEASFDAKVFLNSWRHMVLPAMFPGQTVRYYRKWSRSIRQLRQSKTDLFWKISGAQSYPLLKDRIRELVATPLIKLIRQMKMRLR